MPLEQGQLVAGRFQLERMVGRGGMGSVWKARDGRLDMPCAVKFIEGEIAQNPEATMRFEREAKAAAQLRSPHVVQILDHGVWEAMPYIAMELLEGEDLGKRLSTRGRLSPAETASIITQVCRALSKAHTAGIVHRDLKPDNIFLCRDDDREISKVVDFGIAKATNNALEMDSKTRTGSLLGTPYYMSPEQASGARDKPVDARSDLWSLAVIVFQCLTGALPFDGDALGDLLVKIIVGPIPKPSNLVGDLPLGFDDWWAKASNREPSQRYQTAKEFAEALALVCGTSQMTDVMDRAVIQNAIAAGTSADRSGQHTVGPTPTGGTMSRTIGQDLDGLDLLAPKKKSAAPLLVGGLLGILVLGGAFLALKGKGESPSPVAAAAVVAPVVPPAAAAAASAPEPAVAVLDAGSHAAVAEKAEPPASAAPPAPSARKPRGSSFAPAPTPISTPAPAPAPAARPAAKPSSVGDDLGF